MEGMKEEEQVFPSQLLVRVMIRFNYENEFLGTIEIALLINLHTKKDYYGQDCTPLADVASVETT